MNSKVFEDRSMSALNMFFAFVFGGIVIICLSRGLFSFFVENSPQVGLYRNILLGIAMFIAASDVIGFAVYYIQPDLVVYHKKSGERVTLKDLAKMANWDNTVTSQWLVTVVAASLAMLAALILAIDASLEPQSITMLSIIPTWWAVVLIFEWGDHWSKYVDGIKWIFFAIAVQAIFFIDTMI